MLEQCANLKYDPTANAAYIQLKEFGDRVGIVAQTIESPHAWINLDYDKAGDLVGIEIINFKSGNNPSENSVEIKTKED